MKYELKKKHKGVIPTTGSKYTLQFKVKGDDWTIIDTPLRWLDVSTLINDLKDCINGEIESNPGITNIKASTGPDNECVTIDMFKNNQKVKSISFQFDDYGSEPEDE